MTTVHNLDSNRHTRVGRLFVSTADPYHGLRRTIGRIRMRPHMVIDRGPQFVIA